MSTYVYPTSNELIAIDQQNLPLMRKDDPIFEILPPITKDVAQLTWEQEDNYFGLMQIRGYNGTPPRVSQVGLSQYMARPGVYGEEMVIDEQEVTERRRMGSFNEPIDVQDLVMKRSKQLMHREIAREAVLGWNLLINGYFEVYSNLSGGLIHRDAYTQRLYTATTPWIANPTTSTPLADFRAVELFSRGYSINLGSAATAWMNRKTFNGLVANRNAADLYGQRTGGLFAAGMDVGLNLANINSVLLGEGLPQIKIYDGFYYDDSNTLQQFIPDSKVLVEGKRTDGARLGNWVYTRNRGNADLAAGPTYKVYETANTAIPDVMVYRGFNGTHQLLFPSGFVVMSV
jgi:hypothetical protein